MTHEEQRRILIEYLKHKVEICDWHGVSDAANDLRELEATRAGELRATEQSRPIYRPGESRVKPSVEIVPGD